MVRLTRTGPVARVTLDSPSNANALSSRMLRELRDALERCGRDDGVRAVVLTGEGRVFCSGVDMAERLHAPSGHPGPTISEVVSVLAALPKPVVARVQGHVRGGGTGLVAAADLAVAPERVTFAFTEVRVGVAPAVVAVPVLRRMTRRAFERWALTGEPFGAAEAAASGLLSAAVPLDDDLDPWVDAALAAVLRGAPAALARTKTLPDLCAGPWEDALAAAQRLSDELFASPWGREGMSAFLERRSPHWVAEWPRAAEPLSDEGGGS
jgi:enoyl-CoA hydratase/carnithine racemase